MANSKGHLVKAAFKKASAWGTPVAVGAGGGLYLLREGIQSQVPRIDDMSAGGSPQTRGADIAFQSFAGSIALPARYEGKWLTLLAMLFGAAGAPTGSNPYVHTFTPINTPVAFGTLVFDKQTAIWEYDSVFVDTVKISSQAGTGEQARATVEFGLCARKLDRASTVNTATQIGAITFPTAGHLLHHNLTVRMNANSGGALGSSDVLKVRSFELTFDNKLKKDLFYSGSAYIDQPDRDGFLEVTGSLTVDKYSADSQGMDQFIAGTYMKLDAEWTTGASAIFHLDLPYIQIVGGDRTVGSMGLVANPIPFKAHAPSSAPTGMTGTDLIRATITNTASADYLA